MLKTDPSALLIDVRTAAEWSYVGGPDLSSISKKTLQASWQIWPGMTLNQRFVTEIASAGATPGVPLLLLCRSGARSQSAAKALTAAGYGPCYNVAHGFEGALDPANRRGGVTGWKADGLPWRQS